MSTYDDWDYFEVMGTVPPPIRNVRYQITVVRPFVYSDYVDGHITEQRFDVGNHEVDGSVMMNPWISRDFADGRISHINGVPCFELVQLPVTDHRPAARKAMEQRTVITGNRLASRGRNPPPKVDLRRDDKAALPGDQASSLNLVGELNVVQHGHKIS
jgi:hypothetical protein